MTPTPPDDDAHALAISQAAAHTSTALDALLYVSPLVLTSGEGGALQQARALVSELHRSIEARRRARAVEMRGPVGPAVQRGEE